MGSCITRHGSASSFRRTPSRTLKSRSRLITRSPTRSSSSTVTSKPVTALTIRAYGSSM